MVNKWRNSGGFGLENTHTNGKDLEKLIKYSLDHNWRPVLITIPISQRLIDGMGLDSFLNKSIYMPLKKINTYNIPFFDFYELKNFRRNAYFFSNSDHLNKKGAEIITLLLSERLKDVYPSYSDLHPKNFDRKIFRGKSGLW